MSNNKNQTKSNLAKKSLERSITIQATCQERRHRQPPKMTLSSARLSRTKRQNRKTAPN